MSSHRAANPEAVPLHKVRSIWVLAAVSYGLVIIFTILAVVVYHRFWPRGNADEIALEQKSASITVGSVWIPVYPGAVHRDMTSSKKGGVTTGDLVFTSGDPPRKLIAFYRSRLELARFNVMFAPEGSGGRIEAITNRGKTFATLIFTPAGSGSEVEIRTRAVESNTQARGNG